MPDVKPSVFLPPDEVNGMTELNRDLFRKSVTIPYLIVNKKKLNSVTYALKPYFIKLMKFAPIRDIPDNDAEREVYLNPDKVQSLDDMEEKVKTTLEKAEVDKSLHFKDFDVTYEHFRVEDIFRKVLPMNGHGLSSWSIVGHIIHLNLRDEMLPFKKLIGEVLIDKHPYIKMVVNKLNTIENEFRFFQMEVIANKDDCTDTNVEVKNLNCIFRFDFAKVYWNPRLATEHERIVQMLEKNDVLYDVFSGVGPFAIPAAKKKSKVLANDLNPDSYKYLVENKKLNKVESLTAYNMDGRDFLRNTVKNDMLSEWKLLENGETVYVKKFHIAMNLPALAIEFLDVFRGWLDGHEEVLSYKLLNLPLVHCYCFVKGEFDDPKAEVVKKVEEVLQTTLEKNKIYHIQEVRHVAPNKDMFRISFYLPKSVVFSQPESKRIRSD